MGKETRYPLSWPEGWKRTPSGQRVYAKFNRKETVYGTPDANGRRSEWKRTKDITVNDATNRLLSELRAIGVAEGDLIISTNLQVRLDGLPRSNQGEPTDPGVAVYWQIGNKKQCMAIDRYTSVADNLAAVAATIGALRAIERHGGGEILDRAFQGFAALPERAGGKSWRELLEFGPTDTPSRDEIQEHFKRLLHTHHSDHGGTDELTRELIWAREQALGNIS